MRNLLRELDPAALEAVFRAHRQGLLAAQGECAVSPSNGMRGSFDPFADPRAAQRRGTLAQTEPLMLAQGPMAAQSHEIPAAPQRVGGRGLPVDPGGRALSKNL